MMQPAAVFSSVELPESDRLDVWRETFARKMAGFDVEHSDIRPFFNETRFYSFGPVRMARHASTAIRFRRTRELISKDGLDGFGLPICLAGYWEVTQGQQCVRMNPRTVALIDGSKLLEGGYGPDLPNGHQQLISLSIPRAELAQRVPNIERLVMSPFRNEEGLNLLQDFLALLDRQGRPQDPGLTELVGQQILDLVAFLCKDLPDPDAHTSGVRAARKASVIRYLENNFREPGLSVTQIAAELKISRRYLHDLLNESEESFTQIVNRLRLSWAEQRLVDPRYRHLDVTTIAFQAGFGDLSYFYRLFRRRYQEAPGSYRSRHTPPPEK